MDVQTTDRRVRRTRRRLSEALLSLTLEQGYDAVTVEEITARADTGRSTFYLHFKDKDDLLIKTLEEVFDDLVDQFRPLPTGQWPGAGEALAALAFRHAAANARLYRIILGGQGGAAIARRIRDHVAQIALRVLQSHYAVHLERATVPVEVLANYTASSLMGLINWWLEANMPYSAAEMTAFFRELGFAGAANALGLHEPQTSS